jgi:predicted glutamine amidotransferase
MCRLLGVVAREPAVLSELLVDDLTPFLALACEHNDGWGVASVTSSGSVVSEKEPERADESERFHGLVDACTTDAALIHLRMASPQFAVGPENTHPFGDERVAFAHNGDFTPSTCLDETIGGELLATAQGDTDSERLYLAVRRRLDDGMEPPKALLSAAADVRTLAERLVSLNCLLLTPSALFAYTAHNPDSEVIVRRGQGYFALHYRQDADKVVVASTGWPQTQPLWSPLPEGHVLEIRREDLRTVLHGG